MSRKLTVFIMPMDGVSTMNPCIALGQALVERGHEVIFGATEVWRGKLSKYGFKEEFYSHKIGQPEKGDPQKMWAEKIKTLAGEVFGKEAIDSFKYMIGQGWEHMASVTRESDDYVKQMLTKINPDVIICCNLFQWPSIENFGKPWIFFWPAQPLSLYYETGKVPPAFFGLPSNEPNCPKYRQVAEETYKPVVKAFSDWVVSRGGKPLKNSTKFFNPSPFGNFYNYPQELDYVDIAGKLDGWHQFDTFFRFNPETFEIPDFLKNKPGKLIYLSMGSLASADVDLMKRLTRECSSLPHRFIVSKGPFGDQYDLPDNMCGAQYLPQTNVLQVVDLFITHGGNNSTTEGLYCGKPLIVMPIFTDQKDNARRVVETGLGRSFDPFKVSAEEIGKAIDELLSDKELLERLNKIRERIQERNNPLEVAETVEKIATNFK